MEAFPYLKQMRTIKFVEERKELMQLEELQKIVEKSVRNYEEFLEEN